MNNYEECEKLEELRLHIATFNFKEELQEITKENNIKCNQRKNRNYAIRKVIATTCASFVLISGIAFAINNKKFNEDKRGLGQGVETAIDNGYIARPNMDFISFDNMGTEVKIKDFFMDDLNLSVNFLFKFDDNISNTFSSMNISLKDLIIRDEENRIIFGEYAPDAFEEYCKEHNLNYTYGKYNENYNACALNCFTEKENDLIRLTYNIYSENFPKSKKLYFSFKTITISGYTDNQEFRCINIDGLWSSEIDVPEFMYNRTIEKYQIISCDNEDIEIYSAYATGVGFEIGINMDTKDKNKYIDMKNSYIENEKGEKYGVSLSASRRGTDSIEDFKTYETFTMTKYDATDKIKIVLDYCGAPVNVQLEKIK